MLPQIKRRAYMQDYSDHFLNRDFLSSFFSDGADYSVPAVNIKETDDAFEIEVAAPGLIKDDLKINLDNEILTISADHKTDKENKTDQYMRKEFSYRTFKRSFSVPETVNTDGIKANYDNGVLIVALPKVEKNKTSKNKTIKIS